MESVDEEELLLEDQNKYTKITELNLLLSTRKRRIQELKEKARDIKGRLEREESDKVSTTKTLQQECDKKDQAIKEFEANIEKLEVHMSDNQEQREQRYNNQILEIKKQKEMELLETIE